MNQGISTFGEFSNINLAKATRNGATQRSVPQEETNELPAPKSDALEGLERVHP
jgi:hypothetical protein